MPRSVETRRKSATARSVQTKPRKPRAKPQPPTDAPALFPDVATPLAPAWPWPLRHYQQDAVDSFDQGKKRQLLIWHRRAGKDIFSLSMARRESLNRVGGYWHFFPKHVQARRAIWNGVDPKQGRKFIDIAFADIINHQNNTEMYLEFLNGSTWQLLGSDNYDRIVGGNACGVVFSEWALCDPRAWEFMRPIIRENNGFAIFITTYRGRNHAWQMAQQLADSPDWHVDVRTVLDTHDLNGKRIITDADIAAERRDGMKEDLIQQEYFCNPKAAASGAVYARQVDSLTKDPSRCAAVWNPARPVFAAWNLQHLPVSASVVYVQPGPRPAILAAETMHFATLGEALAKARERRFPIASHVLIDDDGNYARALEDLGIYPDIAAEHLLQAVEVDTQSFLDMADVNLDACADLLDSLRGYARREQHNAENIDQVFSDEYIDTWHSRLAHALELAAVWALHGHSSDWLPGQSYKNHDRRVI